MTCEDTGVLSEIGKWLPNTFDEELEKLGKESKEKHAMVAEYRKLLVRADADSEGSAE